MKAVLHAQLSPGITLSGFDARGRFVLPEKGRVWMGRSSACDIVVEGVLIGGKRNCCFETLGGWEVRLLHAGHGLPILVNGEPMADVRALKDRDVIEPVSTGRPVTFRLVLRWEDG